MWKRGGGFEAKHLYHVRIKYYYRYLKGRRKKCCIFDEKKKNKKKNWKKEVDL